MEDLRIFPQLRIQYYPMRSRNWVQALVIITVYLNSSNSNVSRTLCAIRKFRTWTTTWLGQFKTQHGAKMGLFLTVASWIFWMPCRYRTMEWYCMQTYIYIYICLHVQTGIMNRTVPTDIYWISIQSSISSIAKAQPLKWRNDVMDMVWDDEYLVFSNKPWGTATWILK